MIPPSHTPTKVSPSPPRPGNRNRRIALSVVRRATSSTDTPCKRATASAISVSRAGRPLAGVFFQVQGEGRIWGRGISDPRGEALLVVAGVPITRFASGAADGAVLSRELQLELEASWSTDRVWPLDPDELEQAHEDNDDKYTQPLTLVTGRSERVRLEL